MINRMTAAEFAATPARLGMSRRELSRRLGIGRNSANSYALGRARVPVVVTLAIRALEAGLGENATSDSAPDAPQRRQIER